MSWNNRVLAHKHNDEVFLQIHEVYYSEEGVPDAYTKDGIKVVGDNIEEIRWTLDNMIECLAKPILWAGDRFPEEVEQIKKQEA